MAVLNKRKREASYTNHTLTSVVARDERWGVRVDQHGGTVGWPRGHEKGHHVVHRHLLHEGHGHTEGLGHRKGPGHREGPGHRKRLDEGAGCNTSSVRNITSLVHTAASLVYVVYV